jgi:DNA-directed RNA polymerase subunit RPC12/RpoP
MLIICPTCQANLQVPDSTSGTKIHCTNCTQRIQVPAPPPMFKVNPNKTVLGRIPEAATSETGQSLPPPLLPPRRARPRRRARPWEDLPSDELTHSGFGISSFLIALLVGGIDLIVGSLIFINTARNHGAMPNLWQLDVYCFGWMGLPLALVGVGLGFVAMVAQRDRNHMFSAMGFVLNGGIVVGTVGFFVYQQVAR